MKERKLNKPIEKPLPIRIVKIPEQLKKHIKRTGKRLKEY
jgi:hypothetical protein